MTARFTLAALALAGSLALVATAQACTADCAVDGDPPAAHLVLTSAPAVTTHQPPSVPIRVLPLAPRTLASPLTTLPSIEIPPPAAETQ